MKVIIIEKSWVISLVMSPTLDRWPVLRPPSAEPTRLLGSPLAAHPCSSRKMTESLGDCWACPWWNLRENVQWDGQQKQAEVQPCSMQCGTTRFAHVYFWSHLNFNYSIVNGIIAKSAFLSTKERSKGGLCHRRSQKVSFPFLLLSFPSSFRPFCNFVSLHTFVFSLVVLTNGKDFLQPCKSTLFSSENVQKLSLKFAAEFGVLDCWHLASNRSTELWVSFLEKLKKWRLKCLV